jgi:hypothetical protein
VLGSAHQRTSKTAAAVLRGRITEEHFGEEQQRLTDRSTRYERVPMQTSAEVDLGRKVIIQSCRRTDESKRHWRLASWRAARATSLNPET